MIVRGFGYLTAIVLAVIGIALGILAATNSASLDNVSGRFVLVGGPRAARPQIPVTGKVVLTNNATGVVYTTTTGSNGRWAIGVPPGSYATAGIGPRGGQCPGESVKVPADAEVGNVLVSCVAL